MGGVEVFMGNEAAREAVRRRCWRRGGGFSRHVIAEDEVAMSYRLDLALEAMLALTKVTGDGTWSEHVDSVRAAGVAAGAAGAVAAQRLLRWRGRRRGFTGMGTGWGILRSRRGWRWRRSGGRRTGWC